MYPAIMLIATCFISRLGAIQFWSCADALTDTVPASINQVVKLGIQDFNKFFNYCLEVNYKELATCCYDLFSMFVSCGWHALCSLLFALKHNTDALKCESERSVYVL